MDERTSVRQWVLAGAGLLMVTAAVVLVLRERAPAPTAQEAAPSPRTSLYLQRDGAAWQLHWNPNSPDVRSAKRGAIVIRDGKRESRLELNPRDLRAGVASYWPESQEVAFDVELDGAPAGSVRAPAPVVEERRPSPFASAESPRKKGYPIRRVQAEPAPEVERAKRESGWSRAIGKIPLLRRLRGRRE